MLNFKSQSEHFSFVFLANMNHSTNTWQVKRLSFWLYFNNLCTKEKTTAGPVLYRFILFTISYFVENDIPIYIRKYWTVNINIEWGPASCGGEWYLALDGDDSILNWRRVRLLAIVGILTFASSPFVLQVTLIWSKASAGKGSPGEEEDGCSSVRSGLKEWGRSRRSPETPGRPAFSQWELSVWNVQMLYWCHGPIWTCLPLQTTGSFWLCLCWYPIPPAPEHIDVRVLTWLHNQIKGWQNIITNMITTTTW